jgi:LuxR family maltose regulon positive regulatory protein
MQTVLEDYGAPTPSYLGNAGYVLACIHLLHNASEEAEKLLTQISDYFQMHNYATQQAICQAFQVECALRTGDMERATFLGGSFDFDIRPPLWFFYVPQITPIKLLLAQATKKSLAEARTRLAVILRQMKRINRKNVLIDLMALSSLVHHKQGEESTAMANLKEALDLAEPGGCIRNFADLGDDMQELLERLIQMDPDYVFARHVLAACRADACGTATKVAFHPMILSARTGAPRATLTDREIELLQLVAEGRSNKEIAEKLYISIETVKTHLRSVYKKLEAKGRIQAQNKARSLGLIAKQ